MPFKSQAQRRKFAELLVAGKISPETYEEWNRETGSAKLPERAKPKRRPKPGARTTAKKNKKTTRQKPATRSTRKGARRRPRRARSGGR